MDSSYRVSCGRTEHRGSWVAVSKNGLTIQLSDDNERGLSQIKLRDKAKEILDEWLEETK